MNRRSSVYKTDAVNHLAKRALIVRFLKINNIPYVQVIGNWMLSIWASWMGWIGPRKDMDKSHRECSRTNVGISSPKLCMIVITLRLWSKLEECEAKRLTGPPTPLDQVGTAAVYQQLFATTFDPSLVRPNLTWILQIMVCSAYHQLSSRI